MILVKDWTPQRLELFTVTFGWSIESCREAALNLFRLHVEKDQGETFRPTTWLVIVGNLFDAMSSVPEGYSVKAVDVEVGTVAGPGRVIGRIAAPTVH